MSDNKNTGTKSQSKPINAGFTRTPMPAPKPVNPPKVSSNSSKK